MSWILVGSEVGVLSMDDSWGHQYGNIWMTLRSVEYFLDLLGLAQGAKALETPCSPNLPEPVVLGLFFLQIPRIKFTGHRGWVSKRSILFYGAGGRAELQGSRGSCGRGYHWASKPWLSWVFTGWVERRGWHEPVRPSFFPDAEVAPNFSHTLHLVFLERAIHFGEKSWGKTIPPFWMSSLWLGRPREICGSDTSYL